MSSDNGVYILETEGPEFRVAYLMAFDNLGWDDEIQQYTSDRDVWIKNARSMFRNCDVFTVELKATAYALKISKTYDYLEYGIQSVKIDKKF